MTQALSEQELLEYRLQRALEDLKHCVAAAAMRPFRAGDSVKHAPSGETWVLACDQQDNDVLPAGWPETLGHATHCRLVKAATDEQRLSMLRAVADSRPDHGGGSSHRQRLAAAQLAAIQATEVHLSGNDRDPGIVFQTAHAPTLELAKGPDVGNVQFLASDGATVILLRGDGKIFVRGEQVDDNRAVYEAMCTFLGRALGLSVVPTKVTFTPRAEADAP